MSTRATIKFIDDGEEAFIYRGHDGSPDIVQPDIQQVLEKAKGRWTGGELGSLISMFFGEMYNGSTRLQDYTLTSSFHGDESYKYFVEFDKEKREWVICP